MVDTDSGATTYVLGFEQIDRGRIALVGGKGANLGELSRIEGTRVPAGFCVTTDAYRRVVADALEDRLDQLSHPNIENLAALAADARRIIEAIPIPDEVAVAIAGRLDANTAYAVRSSATAEDLPTASFAGQQDTFLNIIGPEAVLEHVRLCWASLFTERAVAYRVRNGFDHRKVHMAVVVQRMVFPEVSGILFTADPLSGNRGIASIDAGFGLGEAMVSGLVNTDVYKVRDDTLIEKTIATKHLALHAAPEGGTREHTLAPELRRQPALTDERAIRLAHLGRRVEAHFGAPQDIEWCLTGDEFRIVQSRPITALFPVPPTDDADNHIYLSVGHQQMMTDPMKPLGLSIWQLTTPRPMAEAGGRLFVDATDRLASATGRAQFLEFSGKTDPLMRDALLSVLERGDFDLTPPEREPGELLPGRDADPIDTDPAIVADLIARTRTSLAVLDRDIREKYGPELFDFILADFRELRRLMSDPRSHQAILAGTDATWWLNEQMRTWLGEPNAADILSQSAPDNITSEMGLDLLDVADAVRPHPHVVEFLRGADNDTFLDELPELPGGREASAAIRCYLDKYGMRCVGEIDITRPRWSEHPTALLPALLTNIDNFPPGESRRRFERGLNEAAKKEDELLQRLRSLPDGAAKAEQTKAMIDRLRTFVGYREFPKYGIVSRYFVYKKALLAEADRQVEAGVLRDREDIHYLRLQEFHDVARTGKVDNRLIRAREEAFRAYQTLTPPRVLTSDGETFSGSYRRENLPADALAGLPVSTGTVEGRARVVGDLTEADLAPGDILVTAYTDPSWSPVFVTLGGLVTEVGGLLTHGAVIAREYGLPAVVGVADATRLIRDGQRIRVNGTDGYVEILP
ncbi:rifamycin-inactivating phosphotransferase [Nocardia panacis]|uniref:rifamycin-inactivating phosphotransferase n=1 Tax=Nocardia panacis TaxID=2340916 RepID=UPI001EEFD0A0|nr:rifamycin-inactivating phosphotransferase [Nocardia panacis]